MSTYCLRKRKQKEVDQGAEKRAKSGDQDKPGKAKGKATHELDEEGTLDLDLQDPKALHADPKLHTKGPYGVRELSAEFSSSENFAEDGEASSQGANLQDSSSEEEEGEEAEVTDEPAEPEETSCEDVFLSTLLRDNWTVVESSVQKKPEFFNQHGASVVPHFISSADRTDSLKIFFRLLPKPIWQAVANATTSEMIKKKFKQDKPQLELLPPVLQGRLS